MTKSVQFVLAKWTPKF